MWLRLKTMIVGVLRVVVSIQVALLGTESRSTHYGTIAQSIR